MAAVNWDGTEKVIDQSCYTVTLINDVTQKSYVVWEQQYPQSKKQKIKQKNRMLYFKNFQLFTSKYPLKYQYLLDTSYIKMIQTNSPIQ